MNNLLLSHWNFVYQERSLLTIVDDFFPQNICDGLVVEMYQSSQITIPHWLLSAYTYPLDSSNDLCV